MGTFTSTRTFSLTVDDLTPVVEELRRHFERQGYEVSVQKRIAGDWDISLTKGSLFRSVCGLRTALKIELNPQCGSLLATASVGIFGQQAIPTAITLLFFWPLIITQVWGLVAQSKLDDEALDLIGQSLSRQASTGTAGREVAQVSSGSHGRFCTACGTGMPNSAKFCMACGQPAVT